MVVVEGLRKSRHSPRLRLKRLAEAAARNRALSFVCPTPALNEDHHG